MFAKSAPMHQCLIGREQQTGQTCVSVTANPASDMSLLGQAGQTQGWWQICRLARGPQAGCQAGLQAGIGRQTSGRLLPGSTPVCKRPGEAHRSLLAGTPAEQVSDGGGCLTLLAGVAALQELAHSAQQHKFAGRLWPKLVLPRKLPAVPRMAVILLRFKKTHCIQQDVRVSSTERMVPSLACRVTVRSSTSAGSLVYSTCNRHHSGAMCGEQGAFRFSAAK